MKIQAPQTKEAYVYETLKEQIISGTLVPGSHLVQQDIADQMRVSAIPVREALGRLRAEGLVEHRPHQGVCIADLSTRDVEEILLMRSALEGVAIRLAAPYVDPTVIMALRELIQSMSDALKNGELDRYGALNKAFHLKIYEPSPYRRFYRTIVDLWAMADRHRARAIFVLLPHLAEHSLEAHVAIVDAIERGDTDVATSIMNRHREDALTNFLNFVDEEAAMSKQQA